MFQEKLLPLLISFLLGFLLNSVLYMMPDIVVSKSDLFENISDDYNADNDVEEALRNELNCPVCSVWMLPPSPIYQCEDGHVMCYKCYNLNEDQVSLR